ncbi:MAG: TolC family protein [Bacteroidales bacterium]|nr:TolC family protein [Bacteroidales bacterium]
MKPFYLIILSLISLNSQQTTVKNSESQNLRNSENFVCDSIDFFTAVDMLFENNLGIQAAEKKKELSKRQTQLVNSTWFPIITMTGTYTMMSNDIGVSQEYASLLDPLKEKYANDLLVPDVLNYISNELGDLKFDVPVMDKNFGSIDIEVLYPLFTGIKRIYANKLARDNETMTEYEKEFYGATKYLELADIYFTLVLSESMTKVLRETHEMMKNHYSQALKMESNGILDKAERLVAKVALDESERNLKSIESQTTVLKAALLSIIKPQRTYAIRPYELSTPLFMNEQYPQLKWFKDMMRENAFVFKQSELHQDIAKTSLAMSRSNYFPVISVFGKQTIASYNVPSNLIPNTIAGVNLAWDLFDGLARERQIQQVKIETDIVNDLQNNLKNELEISVEEWHSKLRQACIDAAELKSSLELSQEIYRIRKKSFSEGLCTSQQVLDALNLVNKTKLLLQTTYYEYDIALANLCCLCGIPQYFESYITR